MPLQPSRRPLATVQPTLSQFKQQWGNCILCDLWEQRDKIVLGKGDIPAEILVVGEAPGDSEDITGLPFVGPSGVKLMAVMATVKRTHPYRVAYTNLVCCFPRIAKRAKINEPSRGEIAACAPRLKQFIDIVKPLLVVQVGKLTEAHLSAALPGTTFGPPPPECTLPVVGGIVEGHPTLRVHTAIAHPASIVRMPLMQQGFALDKCVVTILNAIELMETFIPKKSSQI